jgi:tetratricopeptide (TPR) repeat protein
LHKNRATAGRFRWVEPRQKRATNRFIYTETAMATLRIAHTLAQAAQRATEAFRRGDRDEAERLCRRILDSNADHYDALTLLGILAAQTRRTEEAVALLSRAAALRPRHPEAHGNLGNVLRDLGRHDEALACYDRALALKPDYAEALNNRGVTLCDLRRHAEALASYDRALSINPNYAEALNNRGVALGDLGRFVDALACYDRALGIRPNHVEALNNRGNALCDLKRYEDASESYERALAVAPHAANVHWNLAFCRLRLGDFARGWPENEWRWKQPEWASIKREYPQPVWLGAEPLGGKTLLLHHEQGLGDTLQFCRYAKPAAARGARVVLVVQPPLLSLLSTLDDVAQVLPTDAELPEFDYHCPLLSLPLAFGTCLDTIPDSVRVRADGPRVAAWRDKLGARSEPRVGIVWSGNPGHKNDRNRSLALADLLPLLSDRAQWVSLQQDVRATDADLLASRTDIAHFGEQLEDFADTAALVDLMDVVVTVDTSVAHLAGAMGKAVWILLPFNPDWRWLLDREDSPWYPTARLFRQPAAGDWASVIDRVRSELQARAH